MLLDMSEIGFSRPEDLDVGGMDVWDRARYYWR